MSKTMSENMPETFRVPLILRGQVIDAPEVAFGGRRGAVRFEATDVRAHLDRLALSTPSAMRDLYELSLDDIIEYLVRLGRRLVMAENPWLQQSYEMSRQTSGLSDSILKAHYERIPDRFRADLLREMAENLVGIDYLEGWVPQPRPPGATSRVRIRAFGARCVHIIAGNVPTVGVGTLIRNALTRSDAIVKTPSNDPLTSSALARTMIEMAPDHPLTRHFSVAYWKGGDEKVEAHLYDPRRVEKIVAWGGFASITHVTRYLQPGLDLITLDPKHSATIIGAEAFADEATLHSVARRLALDIGAMNQEGCVNARIVYVVSGTDGAGLTRANRLGELTFQALQLLPARHSTPHKAFDPELKAEIDALRFVADDYKVFGGRTNEGAIIVSQDDAPVDFARQLACRVANIVPVDEVETAVRSVNAYTQTIGIFPDSLKQDLRDRLAWQGAQRLVSLGGAAFFGAVAAPQDGIEPVRRMVKWIVEEETDGAILEAEADERAA